MGGTGNDYIQGGGGNDVLYGGAGNDILIGGTGSDIFAWSSTDLNLGGADTIRDFSIGQDKLRFDNLFGNPDDITVDDILSKLGSNELGIQANSGRLDVTVGNNTFIEIHSGGGASFDASVLTAANGSEQDKVQLLLQLLTLHG
jgi:Ca2+-binding RTX toxin-like protein